MILANIGKSRIWKSEKQKWLGNTIDKHLKFEEYVVKQCETAGQKLSVLVRVCNIPNRDVHTKTRNELERPKQS